MGSCTFCGKAAGFLRKSHKGCKERHEIGKRQIIAIARKAGLMGGDLKNAEDEIENVAKSSYIHTPMMNRLVASGWEAAVEQAFEDGILTLQEEQKLSEFQEHFSLSRKFLDTNGAYTKIVQGAVLREILEGNIPDRINVSGQLPFNLQKNEQLVWVFEDVNYYEEKTRTRYVGGSQGVSIRIAKGLYYRTGAFKGERVQTSETIHADTGLLGVTNKHLYFSGPLKKFRIKFDKIVTFEPFSDGIGIQRDAMTAKPQSFATNDGWFTYNLITNLAQI
ncbi:hypothetical protein [Sedimenticola selenatireducens]|uniref:Uncharacterized protein n=1 Tax=Sedimenticola selenatireducens TaxID=191960 RepID=A0A2N6CR98_9GAMM|nr:hypothetical protein [Sedimenticola selenatireducens]PLX59582.1 MAG: hypothetical protein C0630_19350 [Sedimenticola selenatireducens]